MIAPLLYLGTAYLFLIARAWMLYRDRGAVSKEAYSVPGVIRMVHLFTLGFLPMTALGILNQWGPVVLDVSALGLKRCVWHYGLLVMGILGFASGFAHGWWPLVAGSGSVLAIAILWWSHRVISQGNAKVLV